MKNSVNAIYLELISPLWKPFLEPFEYLLGIANISSFWPGLKREEKKTKMKFYAITTFREASSHHKNIWTFNMADFTFSYRQRTDLRNVIKMAKIPSISNFIVLNNSKTNIINYRIWNIWNSHTLSTTIFKIFRTKYFCVFSINS